jgi:toxin ParE1/3/4
LIRVIFSPEADTDLEQIADYIAADNPVRAVTFVEELKRKALNTRFAPQAYPRRDDLPGELRMAVHRPYNILFRVSKERIEIARIVHGARDLRKAFGNG